MITYFRGNGTWWPKAPLRKTGGTVRWVPKDKEKNVRKKSTVTHGVCVRGPLHDSKIKHIVYLGHGKKRPIALVPDECFTVPPYHGCYIWDKETERYEWKE